MSEPRNQSNEGTSQPVLLSIGKHEINVSHSNGPDDLFAFLKVSGVPVAYVSLDDDDRPFLGMTDDRGRTTYALTMQENGHPAVAVYRDGTPIQVLEVKPEGGPDFGPGGPFRFDIRRN